MVRQISSDGIREESMIRKALLLGCLATSGLWGQQVLLRVRFVQVDANAEAMLAANLSKAGSGESVGIRALRPGLDLVTLLEDLRARGGGVRLLAEPNLLSSDAMPATLRAGNSVPVPVVRAGAIFMMARELGIHLTLQPTLTQAGVRLFVKPSVTTLDAVNAATMSNFTIPAFGTRTAEAEMDLAPGQSIMIDGLVNRESETLLRNLTGSDPVLDAILKNGMQANTKLVVLVTPEVL
jgi:Flp pilus assembly secretin CpaC